MSAHELYMWEDFYAGGHLSEYPDIRVVRYFKSRPGTHDEVVLDLGCGNGRHAIAIARMGYRVVAVDYSREALKILGDLKRHHKLKDHQVRGVVCDLKEHNLVRNCIMVPQTKRARYALIYGVLDYFSGSEALMLLEAVRDICYKGATLLIAARGELDFCHDNPNRSDGWMKLYKRDAATWTEMLELAEGWGGKVTIDSRLETFQSIPVGGVSGVMLKEHWLFIEAEAV